MLWLGVHLPLLPMEVLAAETDSRPQVVVDSQSRIVLRNTAACVAGIAHGSTLATAHGIVPGLVHYRRNPEREQQRLVLLAEALYGFSTRVSLAPPAADDAPSAGIVLEIGGSLRLFGDVAELSGQVTDLCRGMGHEVHVRWAKTPLAALVLAGSDARSIGRVPLGQATVEPGRLSAERIERFANMGIRTLGQLLSLPKRALAKRFGEDLVDYLDRLTGERPDPRPVIRPADRFRSARHLLEPLRSKEALAFPMQRLLIDLEHWLVARQLGAEQLRWHFTGGGTGSTRICMPVRFARAQQRREAFLGITRLELEGAALPEDVIDIELEARRLSPWAAGNRGLFGPASGLQADGESGELSELVDQLRARLGQDACHTLETADQHTPEEAWRLAPPLRASSVSGRRSGGRRSGASAPEAGAGEAALPRQRPLWLFDPPRPVDRRQLELLRGPERIHTGWWLAGRERRSAEARDYYVARHRSGARCWVFADPSERWFLHGYFS